MDINDDVNQDDDKDEDGGINVDHLPGRTGRRWQGVPFGDPATRESDQPRFSDLSLIISSPRRGEGGWKIIVVQDEWLTCLWLDRRETSGGKFFTRSREVARREVAEDLTIRK